MYAIDPMDGKDPDNNNNDDQNEDTKLPAVDSSNQEPATGAAAEQAGDEQRVERRRRMNMIHSRRKRQRRKIEVEVLKEQVAVLTSNNVQLRSQNQALETMLSQVHQMVGANPQQQQHMVLPQQEATVPTVQPLIMGQPAIAPLMVPQPNILQQNQLAMQQILQYQLLSSLLAQQMVGGQQVPSTMMPLAAVQAFPGLQQPPGMLQQQQQPPGMLPAVAASGRLDSDSLLRLGMMPAHAVVSDPQPILLSQTEQKQPDDWDGAGTQDKGKRSDKEEDKGDRETT